MDACPPLATAGAGILFCRLADWGISNFALFLLLMIAALSKNQTLTEMTRLKNVCFLLFILALQVTATGQPYDQISKYAKSRIDYHFKAMLKARAVVGASIAIVDNGQIVYATGYGFADRERHLAADEHTLYRVGSVTKSFTALSVLQLQEAGQLHINDRLGAHLTDFSIKSREDGSPQPVYIKDVLTHTAGLPSDLLNGFFATNPPDQSWSIAAMNNQYAIGPAKHLMAYSNIGYGLLGELIARKSGQSYADYLQAHIFEPLGMGHTGILSPGAPFPEGYARAYIDDMAMDEPSLRDVASSMVHSNAIDLAGYTMLHLNQGELNGQQVLNQELFQAMQQNQLGALTIPTLRQYGYGLLLEPMMVKDAKRGDTTMVTYSGHSGNTYGYHASFGYIPELGIGAVVLTNTDKGQGLARAAELLELYAKTEKQLDLHRYNTAPHPPLELATAEERLGTYNSWFGPVKVERPDKFKWRKYRVIMKREGEGAAFTETILRYGIFPKKRKDREYTFVRIGGETYLRGVIPSSQASAMLGKRVDPQPVSATWEAALGTYELTGDPFPVPPEFPYRTQGTTATLRLKDGVLLFTLESPVERLNTSLPLHPLNDQDAVGYTYARSTGHTVSVLPGGKLLFSGFGFQRALR